MSHQEQLENASVEDELRHYYEEENHQEEEKQHEPFRLPRQAAFTILLAIVAALLLTVPASATTLNGSGQLALPSNCPNNGTVGPGCGSDSPGIFPTIVQISNTFTGTWPATAPPAYQGQFSGTGPYPGYVGTNTFNFTGLAAGFLPAGSILYLGDVDFGANQNESFVFRAFDSSLTNPITSAWLESAFYVSSTSPGDLLQKNMPEYAWTSPDYAFDGNNVPGNPVIGVWLTTNTDIYGLRVIGTASTAGFGIAAPAVPEPGSLLLMGSGIVGLAGLARRRWLS